MNKTIELYTKEELFSKLITILYNYDPNTALHCLRVGVYTAYFLDYLSENCSPSLNLSVISLKDIIYSASIHDIGKIYVNPKIIVEGQISSDKDIENIKEHTKIGTIFFDKEKNKTIYEGILLHHERYDGEGYPFNLKGEEISIVGRILNITDSFDAMTSNRPYSKHPKSAAESITEIKENLGSQFDPNLGAAFVKMYAEEKYHHILELEKHVPEMDKLAKKLINWLISTDIDITNLVKN